MSGLKRSDEEGQGLTVGSRSSLLDKAYESLSSEQKNTLMATAAEQALAQDVKDRDAQRRFESSGAEMVRHAQLVQEHEKLNADFNIRSEFETASGKTTVTVSKANNTLYIVIAVVVAVVFFVMFSR